MSSEFSPAVLSQRVAQWQRRGRVLATIAGRHLAQRQRPLLGWLIGGGTVLVIAGAPVWSMVVLAVAGTAFTAFWPETRIASSDPTTELRLSALRLEHWRAVTASLGDAALLLGRTGVVLLFNDKARELFPTLQADVLATKIIRNPEFTELMQQLEDPEDGAFDVTVMLTQKVPMERHIACNAARLPRRDLGVDEPASLVTFRVLTAQERVDRMRADFIANASHELRSPVASLLGFIETLQGPARNDAEARERFLGIMATQAQRMKRLIDGLMSLSRVEMRQHVRPSDVVDVNEIVTEVAEGFEPLAQAANMTLFVTPPTASHFVLGDWDELIQVLQNLIQNALKYGVEGGRVDIFVERRQGGVPAMPLNAAIAISVKDDGPGIAAEHLPRLTERFYRAETAQGQDKSGLGLGLAIVKHIVSRHRGELQIVSSPGAGATFTVLLPEYQIIDCPNEKAHPGDTRMG